MATLDTLTERLGAGSLTTSQFRDNRRVIVPVEQVYKALEILKTACGFDLLADLTAVDYLHYPEARDRFGVIYVLSSTKTGERLIVKTYVNDPAPTVPSAVPLWKGADWMER